MNKLYIKTNFKKPIKSYIEYESGPVCYDVLKASQGKEAYSFYFYCCVNEISDIYNYFPDAEIITINKGGTNYE